jgi:hypothetical protein
MNRLEYTRRARNGPGRARTASEAVTVLAHVARERSRLEQERRSLERRLRRIDARLAAIVGTETRLVPIIQVGAAARSTAAGKTPPPVRAGMMEDTLQY